MQFGAEITLAVIAALSLPLYQGITMLPGTAAPEDT